MFLIRALAIIAAICVVLGASRARATELHLGPQLGFQFYHRNAPEETDSTRLSIGLSFKLDFDPSWPMVETSLSYESGQDTFATQNSVNDKIYRARAGLIYRPFHFSEPVVGLRTGLQYTIAEGVYDKRQPFLSTDRLHPAYWAHYIGAIVGVYPLGGFGVEEEFTAWYDSYFKSWIWQFAFGINVK